MATPHVAGVGATYLQTNPTATPALVASTITSSATQGVVKSPGSGSPNRLLFSGFTASPSPPPPPPPPAPAPASSARTGDVHADGEWTDLRRDGEARDIDVDGRNVEYMSRFRDGGNIGGAANTGSFTDVVMTSDGTIVYKVCGYNTTVCSNTALVTF